MPAWLTRPASYAALVFLLSIVSMSAWGGRDGHWGGTPRAHWDLSKDGFWLHDADDQWVIFPQLDLPAAQISGVGLTFNAIGGDVALAVLWRRVGEITEHSKEITHSLSRGWSYVDLSDEPEWTGEVDALGLRSLHGGPMELRSVTLEVPGAWAHLQRAWRSFWVTELFDQSAVNFRDGTRILGVNLSTAMAVTVLVFVSMKLVEYARSRRFDWRAVCALALAAWVLLDLRFTYDLLANARVDADRYPSFGAADAVVSTDPYPPFKELVDAVETHVPPDADVAFVTDHWTYLIKAPFVFFPRHIVRAKKGAMWRADYILVFLKDRVTYQHGFQRLTVDGEKTAAKRVAQIEDVGAVYEVIKPARAVRPLARP